MKLMDTIIREPARVAFGRSSSTSDGSVNVVALDSSRDADSVTITADDGSFIVIPGASTGTAGVLTAADRAALAKAGTGYLESRVAAGSAVLPAEQQFLATAGYAAAGDGGGAIYKRAATQSAGPGRIQSGDGAWWELVPEGGRVDVRAFGAKGDRAADDTAAVQAAADFCKNTPYCLVLSTKGSHSVSGYLCGQLDFSKVRNIDGQAPIKSTITNAVDHAVLIGASGDPTAMKNGYVRLTVEHANGSNAGLAGTRAVRLLGSHNATFDLVLMYFEIGLAIDGATQFNDYVSYSTFNRVQVFGCRIGIQVAMDSPAWCNECEWRGVNINNGNNALAGSTHGILFGDTVFTPNNHVFLKPSIEEMGTPIHLNRGHDNLFLWPRLENSGDIVIESKASNNTVVASYGTTSGGITYNDGAGAHHANRVQDGSLGYRVVPITTVTHRDWVNYWSAVDRGYFCPKLESANYGAGSEGPNFFSYASVDISARTWTIGSNDRGFLYVPCELGDVFEFACNSDFYIAAVDSSKALLPGISSSEVPYLGSGYGSHDFGTTYTGARLDVDSDFLRQKIRRVRVNRSEVAFLRFEFLPSRAYRFFAVGQVLDARLTGIGPAALSTPNDVKYIGATTERGDRFGQLGIVRGTTDVYINLGGAIWIQLSPSV